MASASETYHEPLDVLSSRTRNMHRALVSLQEELEAVDWYQQRAEGSDDPALREILLHNMREEIEHAAMVLEGLRRNSPDFDEQLRIYLFREGPITELEEDAVDGADAGGADQTPSRPSPSIGSLKGKRS